MAVEVASRHVGFRSAAALRSLVSPWYNALLTVLCLYLVVGGGAAAVRWALVWARWDVLWANARLFAVGTYPPDQMGRVWACVAILVALGAATGLLSVARRRGVWKGSPWLSAALGAAWVASFPAMVWILAGVRSTLWGGLLVTLLLAVGGITLSFPLGVLLALGRRSSLPAVRLACTLYIEVVRGVPLVSILFMAQVLLPLFLPAVRLDKLLRALVGITAFSAAYMAENVRGGLQGVPRGQYEAAYSLGLSPARALALVILPQALRSVVPAIVGQFISLFKDTSLVAIMGILDLLGIARSVIANPAWLGRQAEVYIFAGMIYWLFTYAMSAVSRRLERPETSGQT